MRTLSLGVVLVGFALALPMGSGPSGLGPAPVVAQQPASQDTTAGAEVTDTAVGGRIPQTSDMVDETVPAPIVIGPDTVGTLYGVSGVLSPTERRDAVVERLQALRLRRVSPDSVTTTTGPDGRVVRAGGTPVLAVTPGDAAGLGVSPDSALTLYAASVRTALDVPLIRGTPRELVVAIGLVILSTIVLVILWRLLGALQPKIAGAISTRIRRRVDTIRFQRLEIASGDDIDRMVSGMVWVVRVAVSIALVVLYLPLVFSFFPGTRGIAIWLLSLIWDPVRSAGLGAANYAADHLVNIVLIVLVTWKGLQLLEAFFKAIEERRVRFRNFYPDWAKPTFQILRVLILAFALILIWPHLPNSDSRAFQGVAAFLGLLVTFGSAGAVSNAVGGVVMIYMRPFQDGDRVQIAETMGDIVERGMLVTRIRTPKNVVVTIPNAQVLSSHMINYSRAARKQGIYLHTKVTIGYDIPWPKVHETMLAAARKVDGILAEPGPFVLQTALTDYTVEYELNAATEAPERMGMLYSELHREIQTEFAKAGIEITSPAFHAVRDGNTSTVPPVEVEDHEVDEEILGDEPAVS
ncbi:MAG TPA: mechanosensitive ion channel family protein [Longimicrobiales bacterium]|nr:mechanosensitive ion channel family protein [Longimicrobiales bacterium]